MSSKDVGMLCLQVDRTCTCTVFHVSVGYFTSTFAPSLNWMIVCAGFIAGAGNISFFKYFSVLRVSQGVDFDVLRQSHCRLITQLDIFGNISIINLPPIIYQ